MRSGHGSFDFVAQFARGNGAEFAPADLLDILGARTFVNDGVIDDFDVRNINGVVDNRGVVHDGSGPNGLEKAVFLNKHVSPLGNCTGVYLHDA